MKVSEGFWRQATFFQPPKVLAFFTTLSVCVDHFSLSVICTTTVVLSANLMIELESFMVKQSWVNREYRTWAENAPLWGPSVEDQWSGDVVS